MESDEFVYARHAARWRGVRQRVHSNRHRNFLTMLAGRRDAFQRDMQAIIAQFAPFLRSLFSRHIFADDQPSLFQNLYVFGNAWVRNAKRLPHLIDVHFALEQQFQHPQARLTGQRFE